MKGWQYRKKKGWGVSESSQLSEKGFDTKNVDGESVLGGLGRRMSSGDKASPGLTIDRAAFLLLRVKKAFKKKKQQRKEKSLIMRNGDDFRKEAFKKTGSKETRLNYIQSKVVESRSREQEGRNISSP
ncbi:hypothetical protein KPH14_008842 [Odynerus spinipes]|uniref:Uncharacterized protein n=1 Tax=Odynerus spinipes TaxID=1348599 RepID=A0AAD9VIP0_9HYME|nr:hypothetical protein KPH14_008842 [Odynerus spinipes]